SEKDNQVSENTIDTDNKESFDLEYDTYYEIGEDIPEGEYILVGEENAFLEISSDDSGDIESVIHNDVLFEDQFTYLTFENGQYFSFNNAKLFTIDNAPTLKPEDGIYQSGMYKVGEDIPAGTYEVVYDEENSELDSGYVEVAKNSGHDARDIIENDIVEDSTEVTIENGQYITLRDMMIDTNK